MDLSLSGFIIQAHSTAICFKMYIYTFNITGV